MILDMTSGCRAIWLEKEHSDCVYVDRRALIVPMHRRGDKLDESSLAWTPDVVADNAALPFRDNLFSLLVYDPPHRGFTADSNMGRRYGSASLEEVRENIRAAAKEAHRVAMPGAHLAMKWNDIDISINIVLGMMFTYWRALFGHSMSGEKANSVTRWVLLRRVDTLMVASYRRSRRASFITGQDSDDFGQHSLDFHFSDDSSDIMSATRDSADLSAHLKGSK